MYYNKIKKIVSSFMVILFFISLNLSIDFNSVIGNKVVEISSKTYAAGTTTIDFSESKTRDQSKTIKVPKLSGVESISVDNGKVSYSIDGEYLTVNVSNGTPTSNSYSPSTTVNYPVTNYSDSFSNTYFYNDGTYSGTINRSGGSIATFLGGSIIPGDSTSKTLTSSNNINSFSDTISYSAGGYSGTLYKSGGVRSDGDSHSASSTRSVHCSKTSVYAYNSWHSDSISYSPSDYSQSINYSQGGYSGTLSFSGLSGPNNVSTHSYPSNPSQGQRFTSEDSDYTANYSGTVTKPASTYYQDYSGTVTKPSQDTRQWGAPYTQYYYGTVYAAKINYYKYKVTVNYLDNRAPTITNIFPENNQIFSEIDTSYIPKASVEDQDGNELTCKYFIDNIEKDSKKISNTATAQIISFNAFDMSTLSEGSHNLKVVANDGIAEDVTQILNFKIDRSAPKINSVDIQSTYKEISILGTANDSIGGLDLLPYRYTIGNYVSEWTSKSPYISSSLLSNTKYSVKFESRDVSGHIVINEQDIYTKAQTPEILLNQVNEDEISLRINDQNPSTTNYEIMVDSKYTDTNGKLIPESQWITLIDKQIVIKGLSPNRAYSIKVKAKNDENISTDFCQPLEVYTLPLSPIGLKFTPSQRMIALSWDTIPNTVKYELEVDGTVINNGQSTTFIHNELEPETVHVYRIRVVNPGGNSQWSEPVSYKTWPIPPENVNNIQIIPEINSVQINWDTSARATNYEMIIDGKIMDVGNKTSYYHSGLEAESEHTYQIRAVNIGGKGQFSTIKVIKTLPNPPSKPTNIEFQKTKTTVNLSWDTVDRATGYEIQVDGIVLDLSMNRYFFHDSLLPASEHTYRIRAYNPGGRSDWSKELKVETFPEPPAKPSGLMSTLEKTSISLNWYSVAYAESYDLEIDGNRVENISISNYIVTGLLPGSEHKFRVRAKNISGNSDWCNLLTVSTLAEIKDQKQVSLTNVVAAVTNKSVIITWDTIDNDAEYQVEVDGILENIGKNTTFSHTNLEPNSYHTYRVRVKNNEYTSDWCTALTISTLPNLPDSPEGLQAVNSENEIIVTWEKSENTDNYELEVDGEVLDMGTSLSYIHKNLVPGSSHKYRVRARNISGITSWSNFVEKSTGSPTYFIDVEENQEFNFSVIVENIQDFSNKKFVVKYDIDDLDVIDLNGATAEEDLIQAGFLPGTNIYVKFLPGEIEFTYDENVVPGTAWSGELTCITFKSKVNKKVSIDLYNE